jgi:hypothetical protein
LIGNHREQLVAQLGRWGELWRQVTRAPDGRAALGRIFAYLCEVDVTYGLDELLRLVGHEIGKDVEEAIVTTADILRAEGRIQGRSEGQREMLLKQLGKRFGALPAEAVARVSAAGPTELEAWFDRLFTAAKLADVLGDG